MWILFVVGFQVWISQWSNLWECCSSFFATKLQFTSGPYFQALRHTHISCTWIAHTHPGFTSKPSRSSKYGAFCRSTRPKVPSGCVLQASWAESSNEKLCNCISCFSSWVPRLLETHVLHNKKAVMCEQRAKSWFCQILILNDFPWRDTRNSELPSILLISLAFLHFNHLLWSGHSKLRKAGVFWLVCSASLSWRVFALPTAKKYTKWYWYPIFWR